MDSIYNFQDQILFKQVSAHVYLSIAQLKYSMIFLKLLFSSYTQYFRRWKMFLYSCPFCWKSATALGHIGVFVTEVSRKAIPWLLSIKIISWTLYQETYDPFRILQHLLFIQSDSLQNKNWKIIFVLFLLVYSVIIMPTLCCMVKIMSVTALDCKYVQFLILTYLI